MTNILITSRHILSLTPLRWDNLTRTLSIGLLALAPAPGEWSALDCLQHLVDTERWVFPVRLQALLAGQNFAAYDPDSQGSKTNSGLSPLALAAEFAELREQSLVLFERLVETDLGRVARHEELGPVTLSELLHEWAGHDLMHTVQAERALMQPFILGCGPWKPYFSDHLIGG